MSEIVVELGERDAGRKIEEALKSNPAASRVVVRAKANDRVSVIERVKEFLINNYARTVYVYVEEVSKNEA